MGPQIFGSHLQLQGALLWGFYDIYCGGGGGGSDHLTISWHFWLEASISNWTAALFIAHNLVHPNAIYGGW